MLSDFSVYLFWLIPCTLSFLTSLSVCLNILSDEKLRVQYFQQLTIAYCAADLLQTSVTFLGNHGRGKGNTELCSAQIYGLEFGLLGKATVSCVIHGVSWYIADSLKFPRQTWKIHLTLLLSLVLVFVVSVSVRASVVYCDDNFKYSEASESDQVAADYLLFIFLLVYVLIATVMLFSILIYRKMKMIGVSDGLRPELRSLISRLQLYPLCFIICVIPGTVTFLYVFLTDSLNDNNVLNAVTGFFVSINGVVIGSIYFYYQKTLSPYYVRVLRYFGSSSFEISNPLINSDHMNTDRTPDSMTTIMTSDYSVSFRSSGQGITMFSDQSLSSEKTTPKA